MFVSLAGQDTFQNVLLNQSCHNKKSYILNNTFSNVFVVYLLKICNICSLISLYSQYPAILLLILLTNLLETIGLVKKFFSRLEVDVYLKCIL